jgi:putative ABC transport system permease protein
VTIAAMSLGLLVMILYAGLMEGYLRMMEANVVNLEVGDVQIFADDYRDAPSVHTRIADSQRIIASLDAAGFPATPRLLAFGLAAADESSAAVSFRGIDVASDARVSAVHERVARGHWLDPASPKEIVIGRKLARTLAIGLGEEVVVISQGADEAMAYDLFSVRGILESVGDATDRTGVFMTDAAFRELFVVPEGVHQIVVRRPPELPLEDAVLEIEAIVHTHDVQSWRTLMPTIASMLDSARGAMVAMFLIVYIAIAILILNAMLMTVFERIREFGVLKALGVEPAAVMAIILLETAIQVGVALAIGIGLAIPGLVYLMRVGIDLGSLAGTSVVGVAMDSVWRAAFTPQVFSTPVVTLVSVVAIAVLYPALKASLIQPVTAMRHY